jgi:hypothetical protein
VKPTASKASAAQFADPVVDPGGGGADHHGGAEVGEQPGGGEADAVGAARAGDHRHPAGQVKRRWDGHCPILMGPDARSYGLRGRRVGRAGGPQDSLRGYGEAP